MSLRWRRSGHPRLFLQGFSAGEPEKVIATPFGFIASSNCTLYERAKPLFVDIEPDTANIDPNLIEDAIISRYVIRVGVDEPAPERRSSVRDHVVRRLQEPTQRRRGSRFPAIGLGDGGQGARRCRPYFTPIYLQPFYRAEFGFKEGNSLVTEFAGRASIAPPSRNHPRPPHQQPQIPSPPRGSTTSTTSSGGPSQRRSR